MEYRNLGNSNIKVSAIGFGCMSLGADENHAKDLLLKAYDKGITIFDTADLYDKGRNESIVGKALRPIRRNIVLCTKVGNVWNADNNGWQWNPTKAHIIKAVEESLQRLQTDYIDLYQLHGGTINDDIDDTISAFELLKQQGKIREYGISSIRPNVIRAYLQQSGIVSVMMQYSLLDRRPEETCLPLLQQYNKGLLVRGAIAQGLLAGKQAAPYLGHTAEKVKSIIEQLGHVEDQHKSITQLALQYVLQHPVTGSVIAGIRTQEQLEDIIGITALPPLSTEVYQQLQQVTEANIYADHR
jgi:aryl-alcohol dehydrogenase-like predicted oxidoreductase